MSIEIRHLRQFVTVAEELHFTRAADRLHIAQPALSAQIKKLEEELDIALFDRNTRIVRLTSEGEAFFTIAKTAVEKYDAALTVASSLRLGGAGRITLGINPRATALLKRDLQQRLQAISPNVSIDFVAESSARLVEEVSGGRLDAAIAVAPVHDAMVRYQLLRQEQAIVALPASHHLAGRQSLSLGDLKDERWILPSSRVFAWGAIMHQRCRNAGFEIIASDAVADYDEDFSGVAEGRGIEVVPRLFVRPQPISGVVFAPLEDFAMPLEFLCRPDNTNPALHSVIRAVLESHHENHASIISMREAAVARARLKSAAGA